MEQIITLDYTPIPLPKEIIKNHILSSVFSGHPADQKLQKILLLRSLNTSFKNDTATMVTNNDFDAWKKRYQKPWFDDHLRKIIYGEEKYNDYKKSGEDLKIIINNRIQQQELLAKIYWPDGTNNESMEDCNKKTKKPIIDIFHKKVLELQSEDF
jgi:hypothetical protein